MVARVVYKFKSKQTISFMIFWSLYMAQRILLVCITLAKMLVKKSHHYLERFLQCRLCQSNFTVLNREIVCQNIVGSVAMYEAQHKYKSLSNQAAFIWSMRLNCETH